jgi:hypothetical protein
MPASIPELEASHDQLLGELNAFQQEKLESSDIARKLTAAKDTLSRKLAAEQKRERKLKAASVCAPGREESVATELEALKASQAKIQDHEALIATLNNDLASWVSDLEAIDADISATKAEMAQVKAKLVAAYRPTNPAYIGRVTRQRKTAETNTRVYLEDGSVIKKSPPTTTITLGENKEAHDRTNAAARDIALCLGLTTHSKSDQGGPRGNLSQLVQLLGKAEGSLKEELIKVLAKINAEVNAA